MHAGSQRHERLDDPMRTAATSLQRAVGLAASCRPTAGHCWKSAASASRAGWAQDRLPWFRRQDAQWMSTSPQRWQSSSRPVQCQSVAQEVAVQPVAVEFVDLAHRLADAAAAVTTPYFRSQLVIDAKADASPVTEADRKAEAAMRALIQQTFPAHGVFGEEEGLTMGSGGSGVDAAGPSYLWVLDPIDGTKSFITGKPLYGTLIALLQDGEPVLGIIDQPILKERWLGVRGKQTTLNGQPVQTRQCGDISGAYLYATSPHMFSGGTETAFARVRDQVRTPLYGCDCYAYGLLASGLCDLVVEADLKPYDYMALVPIITGAGGVITDWKGEQLVGSQALPVESCLDALPGEVVAAGDRTVHQQAIDALQWR